jgi:hypothetical protein
MSKIAAVIMIVAAALGCAGKNSSAPSAAPESSSTNGHASSSPRVPMTVEWILKGKDGSRLTLVARVNRNAPVKVETFVNVTFPAGVTLVSGRQSWTVPGSDSVGAVDETLVFEVPHGASGEILLAADVSGSNFGIHAKKAYPLAEPLQKATAPSSPGPTLEVGGRDYGPSVPAKP